MSYKEGTESDRDSSRPPRREPPLYDIARYWLNHPAWPKYVGNYIGLSEPFCARCQWLAPVPDNDTKRAWKLASKHLDRAHLVDRCLGGLDVECNLVPLCHLCHAIMPSFAPEDRAVAFEWVRFAPRVDDRWQWATDIVKSTGLTAQNLYMRFHQKRSSTQQGTKAA